MSAKAIATNKQALKDYEILEVIEAGIELRGSEVKSLRQSKTSLSGSFARIENGEVLLYNVHISPYEEASYLNVEPLRIRKLLLHKGQISKLTGQVTQKGLTLVPIKAYFNDRGFVKFELALCKGKRLYDRRQDIRRREVDLELKRVLKNRRKR